MKFGLQFREGYQKEAGGAIASEFDNLVAFLQTLWDKILDSEGNIKLALPNNNDKGGAGTAASYTTISSLTDLMLAMASSGSGGQITLVKPQTEQRNSTTTMANDGFLQVPVVFGYVYNIEFVIFATAHGAADIKVGYTGPASPVLNRAKYNAIPNTSTWAVITPTLYTPAGAYPAAQNINTTLSEDVFALITIVYQPSVTGILYFQWAQVTSSVNLTEVRKGSYVRYSYRIAGLPT